MNKWRYKRRQAARHAAAPQQTKAQAGAALPVNRQTAPRQSQGRWRGIVLDLSVIAANLFLLAPLARLLHAEGQAFLAPGSDASNIVSPTVGWLFLSVFAAHALGAYLKRLPRLARLTARQSGATNARPIAYVSDRTRRRRLREFAPWPPSPHKLLVGIVATLLLLHFTIFLMLLVAGWQGTGLNGWVSIIGKGGPDQHPFYAFLVRFVLICFILPLPTFLVLLTLGSAPDALSSAPDAPPVSWRTHPATEFVADLLLYFSIIVLTVILHVLIAPRFVSVAGNAGRTVGDVLASLVPLALAFSIIYLPPRLIYLTEDYKAPTAWLTVLLALVSLAYRTFFPGNAFSW